MDWILEDNMVDGLFFCATPTGRRGGHTWEEAILDRRLPTACQHRNHDNMRPFD